MPKEKKPRFVTPVGEATMVFVEQPSPEYGNYSVRVAFEADDAELLALQKQFETLAKDVHKRAIAKHGAKAKSWKLHTPIAPEKDRETDEPTGRLTFSAKSSASYTDNKTGKTRDITIPLFDAKGQPIKGRINLGRGSRVRVAFKIGEFENSGGKMCGVTAYLDAIKVIELVSYGGGNAEAYGFGDEEDGYEASTVSDTVEGGEEAPFDASVGADGDF